MYGTHFHCPVQTMHRRARPSLSAPAVLALGGSLISAALFAAGSQATCASGIGCSYGATETWLARLSVTVPLASVAHLVAGACVAVDRAQGRRGWYLRVSAIAFALAVVALASAGAQWSAVRADFDPVLARRTGYGMVLLAQATWVSFMTFCLGDAVPHQRVLYLPAPAQSRTLGAKSWRRWGSV